MGGTSVLASPSSSVRFKRGGGPAGVVVDGAALDAGGCSLSIRCRGGGGGLDRTGVGAAGGDETIFAAGAGADETGRGAFGLAPGGVGWAGFAGGRALGRLSGGGCFLCPRPITVGRRGARSGAESRGGGGGVGMSGLGDASFRKS